MPPDDFDKALEAYQALDAMGAAAGLTETWLIQTNGFEEYVWCPRQASWLHYANRMNAAPIATRTPERSNPPPPNRMRLTSRAQLFVRPSIYGLHHP